MGNCFSSRRFSRKRDEAIAKGTVAMQRVPQELRDLGVTDAGSCEAATRSWAKSVSDWTDHIRLEYRILRSEGFPEDTSKNRRAAVAERNYYRGMTKGNPLREDVTRLVALAACAPTPSARRELDARAALIKAYHDARYESALGYALQSFCYSLNSGVYYDNSDSEATVKSCVARTARVDPIVASSKKLKEAFGLVKSAGAWWRMSDTCRRAIGTAVSIQRLDSRARVRFLNADATNASNSDRQAAMDTFDSIDYEKQAKAARMLPNCLAEVSE